MSKTYLSSSEFVSHGHPDRLADNIAASLINRIQKTDGSNSHAAIEVFITRDTIIFGGEATTTLSLTDDLLRECVDEAYLISGYTPDMRKYWNLSQVALSNDMKIINKIFPQSPDIALGTTDKGEDSGYNDQGVFFSSAESTTESLLGLPMCIATDIGERLSDLSLSTISFGGDVILGPDNKVVVTVEVGKNGYSPVSKKAITAITIAVSHNDVDIALVRNFVRDNITKMIKGNLEKYGTGLSDDCVWVINGTGKFVTHGASSDTSMTGRKISVNHPSAGPVWSNKMIGGGSLVKPWHAADFLLTIACRFMANVVVVAGISGFAVVGCGCAIGQKEPQSLFVKSEYKDDFKIVDFFLNKLDLSPLGLSRFFGFWKAGFNFLEIVDTNFFGNPYKQPWEDIELIKTYAMDLINYLDDEYTIKKEE